MLSIAELTNINKIEHAESKEVGLLHFTFHREDIVTEKYKVLGIDFCYSSQYNII